MSESEPPLTLILPGAVNVNGCKHVARDAANDRENDLKDAITQWLENTRFRLVVVDNSGYDFSAFCAHFASHLERIEFLSFEGNTYPRHYGKGFGERMAINYALANSAWCATLPYVLKCTGRYYCSELEREVEAARAAGKTYVIYRRPVDHDLVPSVVMWMPKDAYRAHMENAIVDDSANRYFEHALFGAIWNAPPGSVHVMPKMGIHGTSGTANKPVIWMD